MGGLDCPCSRELSILEILRAMLGKLIDHSCQNLCWGVDLCKLVDGELIDIDAIGTIVENKSDIEYTWMKVEGQLVAKNAESKDVEMFAMIALNDPEWWAVTDRDDREVRGVATVLE